MAEPIPNPIPQQATTSTPPTSTAIPAATPQSIAIITCSTRPHRINPTITAYISSLLPPSSTLTLHPIDLAPLSLPLFNEPTIPAALSPHNPTPHYLTPHARSWSAEITQHSAFIFVTPQYNWSMPASLKNALDYLYHEWVGKPAFVVSYGGHGGGKCRVAVENVLMGLRMRVVKGVEVRIGVEEGLVLGEEEGDQEVKVVTEEMRGRWKEEGVEGEVGRAWAELMKMLLREE